MKQGAFQSQRYIRRVTAEAERRVRLAVTDVEDRLETDYTGKFNSVDAALADLDARVTALEGA